MVRSLALLGLVVGCASAPEPAPLPPAPPPSTPIASEDVLPTPTQLFEKYAAALGGRARILQVQSYRAKGTLSLGDQGIQGALELYMAVPNKVLTVLDMPGFGEVREGFDGKLGWSTDPMSGPRLKTGDELRDLERRSELHYALAYAKFYREMHTTGRRVFGEASCYRVQLITHEGREEILYFDVETGLLVGREALTPTVVGDVRFVSHYEEYRSFGGVLLPIRVRQTEGGTTNLIMLEEIEANPAQLPSFEPPPEIKALLDEADE